jgi:hypothetical protein
MFDVQLMLLGALVVLGVVASAFRLKEGLENKRAADERRRQSMREVAERWHFREWERDLRSSDSV